MSGAKKDRSMECTRCGTALDEGDKFCGACGAEVPSPIRDEAPEQESQGASPSLSGLWSLMKNRPLVIGTAVGVCLLLIVGVGALAAMASSDETLDLSSGANSSVPGGWAVSKLSGQNDVMLVPESYKHSSDRAEVIGKAAIISPGPADTCSESAPPDKVDEEDAEQVRRGYNKGIIANNTLAEGEGTVAGSDARWSLINSAVAKPWFLPNTISVASEYPDYYSSLRLYVCVEELGLAVRLEMVSHLFEDSNKNPDNPPTASWNASVPEAREEIKQDLRQRYEANIEAMMEFLRAVDTDGWDGPTELDDVPTSLEGYDEALEDPFQGRLKEFSKRSAAKQASTTPNPKAQKGKSAPQKAIEKTSPSRTTGTKKTTMGTPLEAAVEDAIRGHYEAIGTGDFTRAYDYFGPRYRAEEDRQGWIESHEADQIESSTINSLKVEEVSGTTATTDVEVSFEDKTGTPRFRITWRLVKEGGRWKLDEQVSAEKTG